jgi:hypothetical protein
MNVHKRLAMMSRWKWAARTWLQSQPRLLSAAGLHRSTGFEASCAGFFSPLAHVLNPQGSEGSAFVAQSMLLGNIVMCHGIWCQQHLALDPLHNMLVCACT